MQTYDRTKVFEFTFKDGTVEESSGTSLREAFEKIRPWKITGGLADLKSWKIKEDK